MAKNGFAHYNITIKWNREIQPMDKAPYKMVRKDIIHSSKMSYLKDKSQPVL